MIFCLMIWICQRLEIKGNVVVHLVTKSYFVCIVCFLLKHVCSGRCRGCLDTNESPDVIILKTCDDCGRSFLQQFCFEGHKAKKLNGEYASYCEFLCTLLNCDDC